MATEALIHDDNAGPARRLARPNLRARARTTRGASA